MKLVNLLGFALISVLLGSLQASANSVEILADPMKPPALALQKMRPKTVKKAPKKPANKVVLKPLPPLVLQSIIYSADRKIAIINDLPVVSGERVEGARVVDIKKDRVTLVRRGKKLELMLDSDSRAINKTTAKSKL